MINRLNSEPAYSWLWRLWQTESRWPDVLIPAALLAVVMLGLFAGGDTWTQ